MIRQSEIFEVLTKNEAMIKVFGVKKIGLFGSFVKDTFRKNSDIDILVEFHRGQKTFDHYMDLKYFLEKKLGRQVDLVVKEAIKPRLRKTIINETRYARL